MTRIIAGRARGQQLVTPKGDRTRPTSDRTREALFSALASSFDTSASRAEEQLVGLSFLDLFAGSGAIGLEAASRGASLTVAVESDRQAAAVIRQNARTTGLQLEIVPLRVAAFLTRSPQQFDLVFADPPYDMPNAEIEQILSSLARGWLAAGGLVVIERSRRTPPFAWPDEFADTWLRGYGETVLYYAASQFMEGT